MAGLIMPQLFRVTRFSFAFTDHAVNAANQNIYTFSGRALGVAAANRKILVAVGGGNSSLTVDALTVGGVSASLITGTRSTAGFSTSELWLASVPSGTTGDIVVDWSGAGVQDDTGIGVWAIYGTGAEHDVAVAAGTTGSLALGIDVPAGGAVFGFVHAVNNTQTFTWTNADENFDAVTGDTATHSGASKAYAAAQTGLALSVAMSGTTSNATAAAVSFGKA